MSWDIPHKALTYERLKDFLAYVGASENEIQSELPNKLCLKKSFFIRDNFTYFHEQANERGIYIKKYSVGSSEENASAYNENQIVIEPDIAYYMPNTPQPEYCNIHIQTLNGTTYNGKSHSDELLITVTKGISEWTSEVFAPPSGKQGTFTFTLNGSNYTLQNNKVILQNIVDDQYLVSSFIEEVPDSIVISINQPSTCLDPNAKVLINDNGDNSIIVIKENNQLSSETFTEVSSQDKIQNNGDYYLQFNPGNLDGQTGLYTDAKYIKLYVKLNNTTYTQDIELCVLPYFGYTGTHVNIDWENTKYLTQGSNATCTVTLSDTSDVNKFIGSLTLSSGYETAQSNNPIKFTYENLETTLTGPLKDNLTQYTLTIKSPYECSLTFTNIQSFLNIEAITSNSKSDWWDIVQLSCSKITTLVRTLTMIPACSQEEVIREETFNVGDLNVGFFGPEWDTDYSTFLGRFKGEQEKRETLYENLPESIEYEGINYSRGFVSMECQSSVETWWKPCSECTLGINYSKEYEIERYGEARIMGAEESDSESYEDLCPEIYLGTECHNKIITGQDLFNLKCMCYNSEGGEGSITVKSVKLGNPPTNGDIDHNADTIDRNWISLGSEIRKKYNYPPTFYIIYSCGSGSGEDYATLSCAYISNFSVTYTPTENTPSLGTDITINGNITLVYNDASTSTTTISDLGPKVSVIPYGKPKWRIKISPMFIGDVQVKSGSCKGNPFEYDKVIDFSKNPPTEV